MAASAISRVLNGLNKDISLKQEQAVALEAFIEKKDVFALLPTGFGKSLIYQLAPLVAKEMGYSETPLAVVVSPLIALMEDQVREATKLGIRAGQLGVHVHSEKDIASGQFQLIFGSPESFLIKKWRKMLESKYFNDNLIGLIVDEVHLTYLWGEAAKGQSAFRESFSKLGQLRSIVKEGTPILALTASADLKSRARVIKKLHLENAIRIMVSPNRSNIRLSLTEVSVHSLSCLDWIVRRVREKGLSMAHILIYCRSIKVAGRVYCYLKAELGEDAWVDRDQKNENLLIGMYHSHTAAANKARVIESLSGQGTCRVTVATTALSMGLNFPHISDVVLYGLPSNVEAIVQQIGRAGRDGSQAHAVMYAVKQSTKLDAEVKALRACGGKSCLRKSLYSNFEESPESIQPGHNCCSYCNSMCACTTTGCIELKPMYEVELVSPPGKQREVLPEDKVLIREMLEEYRATLLLENAHLYTSQDMCTGFGSELIDSVLEHSTNIFDMTYIIDNLPVFSSLHAQEILHILNKVYDDIEGLECTDRPVPESLTLVDMDYLGYCFGEYDDDDDIGTEQLSWQSTESDLSVMMNEI